MSSAPDSGDVADPPPRRAPSPASDPDDATRTHLLAEDPPRAGLDPVTPFAMLYTVERVSGIGGLFFRAQDPEGLSAWYARHLGVDPAPDSYDEPSWQQEAGSTVFSPFPADSEHFRRPEQQWAVNFRVRDLSAMVAQLRAAGVSVVEHAQRYPNGRFAELTDPEGNPIQLWEPDGADRR